MLVSGREGVSISHVPITPGYSKRIFQHTPGTWAQNDPQPANSLWFGNSFHHLGVR